MKDKTRGYVKGLSMWPNLIPGDILKTEEISIEKLAPAMIALFPESKTGFIVHRVLSIKHTKEQILIKTGGDRSGPDTANRLFNLNEKITKITGVLRKGKYVSVKKTRIPQTLSPGIIVRIYNKLIRTLFW